MAGHRRFKRPIGTRRYRRLFILATEGSETEPQYFNLFNNTETVIHVKCLKGGSKSSPLRVLARMEKYIKKEQLRSKDEAWLVVDKDQWTDEQLHTLYDWSQKDDKYGLAVSNPKFEFWLLLHFEDGSGITNSHKCTNRLLKWLPNFSKGYVDTKRLSGNIVAAIQRAKQKDAPPCNDWPRQTGTTVYKLVEQIQFSAL